MRCFWLIGLVGCGAEAATPPENVFNACAPLAVTGPEGATAEESASLDAGVALWNDAAHTQLTRQAGSDTTELPLRWVSTPLALYGQYEDGKGYIILNRRMRDDFERTLTLAHELGHAFGLVHIDRDERRSVMNPNNLTTKPTPADVSALAELWGPCEAPTSDTD